MVAFMPASAVPPGLGACLPLEPANKLAGYVRMSLRDSWQGLATSFHQSPLIALPAGNDRRLPN